MCVSSSWSRLLSSVTEQTREHPQRARCIHANTTNTRLLIDKQAPRTFAAHVVFMQRPLIRTSSLTSRHRVRPPMSRLQSTSCLEGLHLRPMIGAIQPQKATSRQLLHPESNPRFSSERHKSAQPLLQRRRYPRASISCATCHPPPSGTMQRVSLAGSRQCPLPP